MLLICLCYVLVNPANKTNEKKKNKSTNVNDWTFKSQTRIWTVVRRAHYSTTHSSKSKGKHIFCSFVRLFISFVSSFWKCWLSSSEIHDSVITKRILYIFWRNQQQKQQQQKWQPKQNNYKTSFKQNKTKQNDSLNVMLLIKWWLTYFICWTKKRRQILRN